MQSVCCTNGSTQQPQQVGLAHVKGKRGLEEFESVCLRLKGGCLSNCFKLQKAYLSMLHSSGCARVVGAHANNGLQ